MPPARAITLGAKTEQTDAERIGREAEQLPVLTLARYVPSRYRREGPAEAYEVQVAGLLRSGLLKRFESSSYAFAKTCRKMAASIEDFLDLLAHGQVATGQALAEWTSTDSDDLEALEDFVSRRIADLESAALYDVEALKTDAEHDREVLLRFAEEAEAVTTAQDPKLAALAAALAQIARQAQDEGITDEEVRDMRKVIVFSYFTDTVDWIMDYLEAEADQNDALVPYRDRITAAAGNRDRREEALFGFAPRVVEVVFDREGSSLGERDRHRYAVDYDAVIWVVALHERAVRRTAASSSTSNRCAGERSSGSSAIA